MSERWVPCSRFPQYEISSHGRLRHRRTQHVIRIRHNPRTKQRFVSVSDLRIHRQTTVSFFTLMAEAFLGPRPPGMMICHRDGDRGNNHATNLRYGTQSEAIRASYKSGLRRNMVGVPRRSLTQKIYDTAMKLWKAGMSQVAIGKKLGICNATVCKIVNRKIRCRVRQISPAKTRDMGKDQ
jgi:hypothetical protein